ncbi:Phosphate-binding protein pstS precursor [uncultured Eubacterium sp.]|uniref:substrate-binding domain-containing protein n=1 Tax=Emergencia sp. TaxID=1926557 RepID=UPI0008233B0B|nr:Phosphate-binding protein pstS precursor [uncultured Eubacterium sp.]
MKKLKKILAVCLAMVLLGSLFTACGSDEGEGAEASDKNIHVTSREEGSGTRGAFIELFGIEQKDENGEKMDHTIDSAEITNSTSVMMQTIAGDTDAIGYISLGSLDDSVKALKVDGVEATLDNVKSGDYKVSRPFNIVTKKDASDAAKDFINYIMSEEGQAIVEEEGYVSQENTGAFKGKSVKGEVKISGSSSVTPLMQKLAEEYQKINKDVEISVQQSDSTTGVTDATKGVSDIGMASRALTDDETAAGVDAKAIALDGIAVIVNLENALDEIASDSVLKIYTGEITKWSEVK